MSEPAAKRHARGRATTTINGLALLLAGCGGGSSPPAVDAALDASPAACVAQLTGNFVETSMADANCPTLTDGALAFSVPIAALASKLDISIQLAPPAPGSYSSAGALVWSARAVQLIGNGICLYSAGSDVVPHGDFTLALDSLAPHGVLTLTQYVLVYPDTDCGDGDTEQIVLTF
jgi:hypothetical protein